eukprot:7060017-Prymnesium_polylepis.1
MVDPPPRNAPDAAAGSTSAGVDGAADADDADDECQFVGRTGDLALADFPHCREKCATRAPQTEPRLEPRHSRSTRLDRLSNRD